METQGQLLDELAWLRRVVKGLVGNDAAALDLTQEVALEVLRRPPTADGAPLSGARLRGWLWTIARRKAGRERQRAAARTHSEERASRPERQDGPDRSKLQLTLHQELLGEIHELDPDDGDLIVQRYLDQKPPREIAKAMGLPVPTVRKRLSRAMDRLRARLAESKRGAEGWSAGLCVILGGSRGSVPIIDRGEKAALRTTGVTGTWKVAALALAAVGAGAAWLALGRVDRGPKPAQDRAARLALADHSEQVELAPPPLAKEATVQPRVALATEPGEEANGPKARGTDDSSTLRIVDEAGATIRGARAIWGDEDATPNVLHVGQDGVALLPKGARGWIYAGADGFENRERRVEWTDAGEMRLVLRRERTIPGRLLVDGVAPGRELTLWQDRFSTNHWPHQVESDVRMKAALADHGLEWVREAITVDEDGHFALVTRATWTEYFLHLPADLRTVRAEAGREVFQAKPSDYGDPVRVDDGCGRITILTESLDATQARFVDGETKAPMQGLVEVWSHGGDGERAGPVLHAPLDAEGRLRTPVRFRGSRANDEWQLVHSHEFRLHGLVVRRALAEPGVPLDFGTFEVPRAPLVRFQTVSRSSAGYDPVRAAVVSEVGGAWTESDGTVRLRAEIGSVVQVLAPGHGFQEIVVSPTAIGDEPEVVELEPAPRLRVRFELGDMTGFVADESVDISLKFRGNALAGLAPRDSEIDREITLHGLLHGTRFKGRRGLEPGYDDAVYFRGLPGRDLWIDGLLPASRFDVVLHDRLGGVLAKTQVVMPPAGDSTEVALDFGDLYEDGAASLVAHCRWPSSGRPFEGWVSVIRTDTGRIETGGSHDGGIMTMGPLATGRYRVATRNNGTPREGDGVEVVLSAGTNTIQVNAVGTEPTPR